MGTRSVTTIKGGVCDGRVALYRHFDGYPAYAGKALCRALRDAGPTLAVRRLLTGERLGHVQGTYELTRSAEAHGDLEHTYEAVTDDRCAGWQITWRQRRTWSTDGPEDFELAFHGSLEDFELVIRKDRRFAAQRVREERRRARRAK